MTRYAFSLTVFFILYLTSFLSAQDKKTASLKTEGTGEIKTAPDQTVVYMEVTSRNMNFNTALQDLNKKYSILAKELSSAGFPKSEIKTQGYSIDKNIIYTHRGPVDSGYIGRQSLSLEFPYEQAKIIKLVKAFTESKTNLIYHFSFTLSDPKRKQVETELMRKAVADAKENAAILSSSAGVSLKKILFIEYGKPEYTVRPYAMMAKEADASSTDFSGFNVREIEMKDQVIITWEIGE